ncbi:MAG TPA: hypothetical protein PLB88_10915 [Thermoanaerobaculaceae bacterium]|nr:hypothetical protein [Thermoanaerobaculaceae bacterium]
MARSEGLAGVPLKRSVRRHDGAPNFSTGTEMRSHTTTALYVVLMAAVIVAIDVLFFQNRFWERLTVNVGIVLVFAAFYFRFLKHP